MDTLTIEELSRLSGVSKRSIRFYVYERLLEPPAGNTKAASYSRLHLERLLFIRRMGERGHTLKRIRELLHADEGQEMPAPTPGSVEVWSRIHLGDGIELALDAGRARLSSRQVRQLARSILTTLDSIRKEHPAEKDQS